MGEIFDAIIIGLGPAGATALRKLSDYGLKVVGLDRRLKPEIPTICGEYIPELKDVGFIRNYVPHVEEAYKLLELSPRFSTFNKIVVEVDYGYRKILNVGGFTISRRILVEKLLINTSKIFGKYVIKVKINNNKVIVYTHKEKFESEYAIVATGLPSPIYVNGFPPNYTKKDYALGVNARVYFRRPLKQVVYMYISKDIPGGYAWIIPRGNVEANVGFGVRASFLKPNLNSISLFKKVFDKKLLKKFGEVIKVGRIWGRWIPVGGFSEQVVLNDRVYVIGDSAGLVNPINGGGIPLAIASGIAVAKAVENNNPEVYKEFIKNVDKVLRIGLAYRRIVDFSFKYWVIMGRLGKFIPTSFATRVLKGEPTFLSKLLGG